MSCQADEFAQYECVDPPLGKEMWRTHDPRIDPELLRRLENHLTICHACRMAVAFENHLPRVLSRRKKSLFWLSASGAG